MAEVRIERLALEVPGLAPADGHRLGEMVARRLARERWAPTRGADRVNVAVTAPTGNASLDELAGLIVDELKRQMM